MFTDKILRSQQAVQDDVAHGAARACQDLTSRPGKYINKENLTTTVSLPRPPIGMFKASFVAQSVSGVSNRLPVNVYGFEYVVSEHHPGPGILLPGN
jgi:hypothetical protein